MKNYEIGTSGEFQNLTPFFNGKPCEIIGHKSDDKGSLLVVRTLSCMGAQPSGVEYEIHLYEFKRTKTPLG